MYFLLLIPVLLSTYVSAEEPVSSVKKLTGVHKHIPTLLDKYAKLETDFSELKDIIQKFKELGVMPEAEVAPPVLTTEAPGIHSSSAHDRLKALSSMWHKSHASDGGETSIDDQESPAAAPKPAASVSLQSALDMLRARLQKPHSIADQLAEEQPQPVVPAVDVPAPAAVGIPAAVGVPAVVGVPAAAALADKPVSVLPVEPALESPVGMPLGEMPVDAPVEAPVGGAPSIPSEIPLEMPVETDKVFGVPMAFHELPQQSRFDVLKQRLKASKGRRSVPVDRSGYHTVKRRSADDDNKLRRSRDEKRRHRLSKAGQSLKAKARRYNRFKKEKGQKRNKRPILRWQRGRSKRAILRWTNRGRSKRSGFLRRINKPKRN